MAKKKIENQPENIPVQINKKDKIESTTTSKVFVFKNISFSILTGLVVAGIFSFAVYTFATWDGNPYPPGTLNPECLPTDANCTIALPSVPYTGATSNVNLGSHNFTTTGDITAGTLKVGSIYTFPTSVGSAGYFLKTNGDGTLVWSAGVSGPKGDTGETGAAGSNGSNGTNGTNGSNGADGITYTWRNGAGAPSDSLGINGDYYLNTTNGDVYTKSSGSYHTSIANIKGAKGDTGDAGAQGETGAAGSNGSNGTNGTNGTNGADGITYTWRNGAGAPSNSVGINGDYYLNNTNGDVYTKSSGTYSVVANIKGAKGDAGDAGAKGDKGETGAQGAQGPTIYPGSGIAVSTGTAWGTSLAVGSDIQAYSSILSSIAGLSNSSGVLTNNGSGTLSWSTPSSGMSNPMDAIGQIIYGGTSGAPAKLAAGSSGQLLVSGGAGAPSWSNGVTYDSGVFTAGTGSEVFTVLSGGNVGIGNTNPSYKLDVNGDINIASGSHFKVNGTNLAASDFSAQASSSALSSIAGLTWSSGTPLVKMTAAGTFGLDTNTYVTGTPWTGMGYLTAVSGTNLDNVFSSNGLLKRTGEGTYTVDTNTYITSGSLGAWNSKSYPTDGTGVLTNDGSGTLSWAAASGGMSNPMDAIGQIIYGGTSGAPAKLTAGSSGQLLVSGGAGAPSWSSGLTYDTGTLTTGTGDEVFTVLSSGNVGIGNTNPSYKLDVNGDINIASGSHFKINGTNLAAGDFGAQASSSALSSIAGLTWSSGTPLVKMTADGTFGLDTNTYLTSGSLGAWNSKSYPTDGAGVLTNDGEGNLTWSAGGGGGGMSNPMDAIGQIIYGGTSGAPTKLAAGSAGQMLVSGGAGAPSWTDGVTYDAGILTVGTGSQLFTFLSNGNFGIGNTEPAYPLDVNGDVNIATGSHFKINGTNLASSDIGAQDLSATLSSISGLSDSAGVLTNDGEGNLTWSAGGGGGGMSNPMDAIGQIIYGGTSGAPTKLAAGSSGQILVSGGGAAPVWSTATYPSTTTENQILFSTSNNVIGASTGLTYDDTTGMTVGSSDEIFTVLSNGNVGIGNTTPAYPLDIVSSTSVPQFAIENVATTKNTTFGVDSDGNLTITPIGGNATIAGTLTVGASNTTGTLATRVSTSVPTESDANGSIVINSGDYPGIYFRYGNSWQYAAEVGGFQIPKFENTDPISGEQIKEGDIVLGMINKAYADEGLHGIWVTWNSVKNELLAEIEAKGLDVTGALGTGEVSGVQTTTLADKVKNVLSTMGISIKDGVTNITKLAVKSFSADTATIKGLQMVDKSTGDIYCTWIENGEWQKAKGECGNIVPAALVTPETPGNETPAPVETPTQPPAEQPQQPQSQEPQASQTLNISSVASILDINIAFGTALASVGLPAVSTVTLSDSTTQSLLTVWDNGNPSYDANTAGTYVFSGTLSLPENITNTNNITASANVIIAPQPVQVETPVSDAVSETSEVIQNAAAGLMNGIVNFFKWIFGTVTQTISSVPAVQKVGTSLSQQTMSLSSGTAGLLQPIVKFLGW